MPKFYDDIDIKRNELKHAVIHKLTAHPDGANVEGQIYYDSNDDALKLCTTSGDDGVWVEIADTSTYGIVANQGISVVNQQFALDIPGLADLGGTPVGADTFAVYDASASTHKEVTYTELISGLGGMTTFYLEDDAAANVAVTQGEYLHFVGGNGLTSSLSDTDGGDETDPHEVKFDINAAQTTITSLHADGLTLGNNASADADYFKFVSSYDDDNANGHTTEFSGAASVGAIEAYLDNTKRLTLDADGLHLQDPNQGQPILSIKSLNTTPGNSATIRLIKDVAGGDTEDGEHLGSVEFWGDDEGTNQTQFAGIVGSISESDNTDEAGKLELKVAESDGTTTALTTGLMLEGEHTTDGQIDVTIAAGVASTTTVVGNTQMNNTLTVGADATGKDVKFFGATTGKYMEWDASEDGLVIATPADEVGLGVYTVDQSSTANFKVGRNAGEYWGVGLGDHVAQLIHRQDETAPDNTAANYTSFEIWCDRTGDNSALKDYWRWATGTESGTSITTVAELDRTARFTLKKDASVLAMGAGSDITLTHDGSTGGTLASAGDFIVDSTAGSLEVGTSLANAQTLKLGPASATQMVFTPHGTAASEKISITNTAGSADDAIKMTSTAGGVNVVAATTVNVDSPIVKIEDDAAGRPLLQLESTHTTRDSSAKLQFIKDAADVQDGENLGEIDFRGDLGGGTSGSYIKIIGEAASVVDGDEAGRLTTFVTTSDGSTATLQAAFKLEGTADTNVVNADIGYGAASTTTTAGHLTVTGDLTVSGTTTTVDSTVVTIDDPVFTLGTHTGADDAKDRGIEFKYDDGADRVGFFGYDDSADAFVALKHATNSSEVFSGTAMNAVFGNVTGAVGAFTSVSINSVALEEQVEDWVGAMFSSNTETGITATYEDGDGTIDLVVADTTVAGDSGSTGITPGDTLTIAGAGSVSTAMSGDTLTVTGTNTQLGNKQATIDISDSDFANASTGGGYVATITHNLSTLRPIVQLWEQDNDGDASEQIHAKIECINSAAIKVTFGQIPSYDVQVVIAAPNGVTVTPSYT